MRAPLRTDYAMASLERLNECRTLIEAGRYAGAIYLAGLAAESMLKAFIDAKGEEIKGHNLSVLADDANFSRRLKPELGVVIDAAVAEATPLWRNLFRYSSEDDLDRMGRELRLRFAVSGRLMAYAEGGSDGLRLWAERLYQLASLIVQEGQAVWQSKRR